MSVSVGVMQLAGLASIGAGAIHAGVAGLHAEHITLTRLFVAVAVAQIGVGLLALVKGGRLAAVATALVNLGAVAAWGVTRLWGLSWIDGLEVAEDPQFTDTACAVLGAIAVVAAAVALVRGRTRVSTVRLGCRPSPSASSRWPRCSSAPTTRTVTATRPPSPPAPGHPSPQQPTTATPIVTARKRERRPLP